MGDALDECPDAYQKHHIVRMYELSKNCGRGPARNHAIAHATGTIIAMMDADDICRMDRLEKQRFYLVDNDLDMRQAMWRRSSMAYFREEIWVLWSAYGRGQFSSVILILSALVRVAKLVMPSLLLTRLYKLILRRQSKEKRD